LKRLSVAELVSAEETDEEGFDSRQFLDQTETEFLEQAQKQTVELKIAQNFDKLLFHTLLLFPSFF
jgi:hypothetical protein